MPSRSVCEGQADVMPVCPGLVSDMRKLTLASVEAYLLTSTVSLPVQPLEGTYRQRLANLFPTVLILLDRILSKRADRGIRL